MNERDPNRNHDETGGADEALHPALPSTARLGPAGNATSRAFVVELASEATDADTGPFCGRVQHLTSLDGGNFTSAETLVSIIRRVLERARRNQIEE
ncbi:MAG: hypothetical protein ABR587_03985 [Candidatus Binatia bacterium]